MTPITESREEGEGNSGLKMNRRNSLVDRPKPDVCLFIYLDNTHEMMMGSLMITRSMHGYLP